jgi:hypothetical protein
MKRLRVAGGKFLEDRSKDVRGPHERIARESELRGA